MSSPRRILLLATGLANTSANLVPAGMVTALPAVGAVDELFRESLFRESLFCESGGVRICAFSCAVQASPISNTGSTTKIGFVVVPARVRKATLVETLRRQR